MQANDDSRKNKTLLREFFEFFISFGNFSHCLAYPDLSSPVRHLTPSCQCCRLKTSAKFSKKYFLAQFWNFLQFCRHSKVRYQLSISQEKVLICSNFSSNLNICSVWVGQDTLLAHLGTWLRSAMWLCLYNVHRQACSSQILSNSTKITKNTDTAMQVSQKRKVALV